MKKVLSSYSALSLILFCIATVNAHVLFAADAPPKAEKDPKDAKKEEKPKEQEFKFSAWCAFRDLSSDYIAPPDDKEAREKSTQTRPISAQWVGFGRRGMWTSIILEMKNTTEKIEFKGSASVHIEPLSGDGSSTNKYETTYSQPFDLGPGTLKQYRFSILCPEDGWSSQPIYIRGTNTGVPFDRAINLHDLDSAHTDFVLVVSESAGGYRYLHYKKKQIGEDDDGSFERQVASVEPADLPTRWHDLMAANLIVIDGPPREALSDTQWEALRGYVQAGGHVLITAGKDPLRLKGQIEDLCGITVGEMTEVTSLDGDFSLRPSPQQKEWKLPVVNVTVSPKGNPIVSRNKASQVVESVRRFYGTGSVTFLAYSLSDPSLQDWPGRSTIPLSILSSERNRRLFRATLEEDGQPSQPNPYGRNGRNYPYQNRSAIEQQDDVAGSLVGFRKTLDRSFANDTPVQLHKPPLVLAFLLIYLLFAVPVSYFIFGWLGRRELAWIFVPVISALFSGISYYIGHHGQVGNLTVNEVSVIETGSGMDTGMTRTFAAIYSPSRDDYSISFPPAKLKGGGTLETLAAPNHLLNPETLINREIDAPTLNIRDLGQTFQIDDLRIQYRSTRHLEFLHRSSLGEGLIARADRNDTGTLQVHVENKVGSTLLFPTLIYDGRALPLTRSAEIATLQNGEEFTLNDLSLNDPRWKTVDEAFFGQQVVLSSARGQHIRNRAAALNAYMRANMDRFHSGVIVAWADGAPPALPLEIKTSWGDVVSPRYEPINLIVLPLTQKKLRTVDTLPIGLSVSLSNNFDLDNPSWTTYSSNSAHQMAPWTYNNPLSQPTVASVQSVEVVYAKLDLPKNYRDLAELGCRMSLHLVLNANVARGPMRPKQKGAAGQKAPTLDGTLYVEAFHPDAAGAGLWKPVTDERFLTGIQTGYAPKIDPIPLPLDSVRATRNQEMILRIHFVPNDQNGVNYQLNVRELQHRILEK